MRFMTKRPCTCGETLYRIEPWHLNALILRFQHGENPEHIRDIGYAEILREKADKHESYNQVVIRLVRSWTNDIHAFEEQHDCRQSQAG